MATQDVGSYARYGVAGFVRMFVIAPSAIQTVQQFGQK